MAKFEGALVESKGQAVVGARRGLGGKGGPGGGGEGAVLDVISGLLNLSLLLLKALELGNGDLPHLGHFCCLNLQHFPFAQTLCTHTDGRYAVSRTHPKCSYAINRGSSGFYDSVSCAWCTRRQMCCVITSASSTRVKGRAKAELLLTGELTSLMSVLNVRSYVSTQKPEHCDAVCRWGENPETKFLMIVPA